MFGRLCSAAEITAQLGDIKLNKQISEVKVGDVGIGCDGTLGTVVETGRADELCAKYAPDDVWMFEDMEDSDAVAVRYVNQLPSTYVWGYDFDGSLGGFAVKDLTKE